MHTASVCPSNVHWSDDGLDRDLYIQTTTVSVLAMDGRRRWLDIQKLVSFSNVSFYDLDIVKTHYQLVALVPNYLE